jgi:hypothetical protein
MFVTLPIVAACIALTLIKAIADVRGELSRRDLRQGGNGSGSLAPLVCAHVLIAAGLLMLFVAQLQIASGDAYEMFILILGLASALVGACILFTWYFFRWRAHRQQRER